VFHVLNRGNCRLDIFEKPGDFRAFLKTLEQGRQRTGMRILAYCLMSNHWHLVLWPRRAKDLSVFMQWVSSTHVRRWREHRLSVGEGHLYQGRFKSFPVQTDSHLLTELRYVEANPLRAKLVTRAEAWRWSSLGSNEKKTVQLTPWPTDRPEDWLDRVINCARSVAT
jgi:putative transposase